MQIDLTKILSQDGKTETFQGLLDLDLFETKIGSFDIVEKTPLELTIVNQGKQVLSLDGSCQVIVMVPCDRCLESVRVPISLHPVREIDMKISAEERVETLDEEDYIEGKILDADKLMHNEILVNWPIQILCQKDCKGICSNCGANHNQKSCDCDTDSLDPRMAAISDIFREFKEV